MKIFYTIDNSCFDSHCEQKCPFDKDCYVGSSHCVRKCKHCYGHNAYDNLVYVPKGDKYIGSLFGDFGYIECSKGYRKIKPTIHIRRFIYKVKLKIADIYFKLLFMTKRTKIGNMLIDHTENICGNVVWFVKNKI